MSADGTWSAMVKPFVTQCRTASALDGGILTIDAKAAGSLGDLLTLMALALDVDAGDIPPDRLEELLRKRQLVSRHQ